MKASYMNKRRFPVNYRQAVLDDVDQLVRMRWDFTNEYNEDKVSEEAYAAFHSECAAFLAEAIRSDRWFIWVAEREGRLYSHAYIQLVSKVPRPGRVTHPFAYMTNVYTVPVSRGSGIGSQLFAEIESWSRQNLHEFIIVWPSEWSTAFYERNGYKRCAEPMELMLND